MNKDFKIALILTVVVIGFCVSMLNGQIPGLKPTDTERYLKENAVVDYLESQEARRKLDERKAAREADLLGAATQYELTRQTAENTRWIFWVLVVGVVELGCLSSFLMFKKR